jgi:hypothetical protein
MPGTKPCPPDCTCGKHNRPKVAPAKRRAQKTEAMRRWRAENPERDQAAWQRSHAQPRNRDRQREYERTVRSSLRRFLRHGLTPEQFMELVEEQQGCCYLCSKPLDLESQRKVHIDHDHSCCRGDRSCGLCVRGIACAGCNFGIGVFGDSPERLERAASALRAANARVAERLAGRLVQEELPLNVARLPRRKESA